MDLELKGRCFLITGGTDGLGLALAKKLVNEGARVGVCGRDAGRLEQAQQLLGGESLCFKADVTSNSDLDSFIDATLSKYGGLDGAVNNAGKSAGTSVATSDEGMWRDDYELKVLSAVRVSRRVLPALEVSKGAIVNVLAIMARTPGANSTPTTASRAAGLALTKAMSHEVGTTRCSGQRHLDWFDRIGSVGTQSSGGWRYRRRIHDHHGQRFENPAGSNGSRRRIRRPGIIFAITTC
jgi:NAD(P)-dependent dehydrogenase (short-subunit alcohol dehydrogenase family)